MIRIALHLSGYGLRACLRNRQSQFFTLALPVLFLVIFASVFGGGGHTIQVVGGQIGASVYAIWRAVAKRGPFLCPECGAALQPT